MISLAFVPRSELMHCGRNQSSGCLGIKAERGAQLERGTREHFGVMEMFDISMSMLVRQFFTFVKANQTVHLKLLQIHCMKMKIK